jgi:hypothetical protein
MAVALQEGRKLFGAPSVARAAYQVEARCPWIIAPRPHPGQIDRAGYAACASSFSVCMSITNRYFTSLLSMRS